MAGRRQESNQPSCTIAGCEIGSQTTRPPGRKARFYVWLIVFVIKGFKFRRPMAHEVRSILIHVMGDGITPPDTKSFLRTYAFFSKAVYFVTLRCGSIFAWP